MSYRYLLGVGAVALGLVSVAASHIAAQPTTTLTPDAATLPRGVWRVRLLTAWNRWDAVYGVPGSTRVTPLAYGLNADSLGVRDLPFLAPNQTAIQALSGASNFQLTTGRLVASANSRVVTSPLIAQYAVTSRVTLGVVIPLVQTRTDLFTSLNPELGFANVGPNPSQLDPATAAANAALVGQFAAAAGTLNTRLTACQQNPTQPQCAPIVGHEAEARALIQSSNSFASQLALLYGTGAGQPGQLYVPLSATNVQGMVNARIARFDTLYNAFLGANTITGTIAPAQGPAALIQLQDLMTLAGHDSIGSPRRTSIGDITIGAALQVINTFGDSTASAAMRVAVNGNFRIGTGEPAQRNKFYDIGTGYGQPGIEGGAAAELRFGQRWSASALGSYTLQLGTVHVDRVPNALNEPFPLAEPVTGEYSAGNVLALTVLPRFRLSRFFGLNGIYSLVHVGADSYTGFDDGVVGVPGLTAATEHRIGFGFSYSTATEPDRAPGRLPFEVTYNHSETIAGTGGPVPKTFRDQLELRVYFGKR